MSSHKKVPVLSTAGIEAAAAAASQAEVDPEIRGDPRMSLAVEAKLNNPQLSLSDALKIGGFAYPPGATASVLDHENVTLGQRKNQLNRRLRRARLELATTTTSLDPRGQGHFKTGTVSSATSLSSDGGGQPQMAGRKRPPPTALLPPQNDDSSTMRPSGMGQPTNSDAFSFLSGYSPAPAASLSGIPLIQQQQGQGQVSMQMPQGSVPLAMAGGTFSGQMPPQIPNLQDLSQSLILQQIKGLLRHL